VVTGAARGIGAAIAKRLATEGARVVIGDLDPVAADKVAEEITTRDHAAFSYALDVSDLDSVSTFVEHVHKEHGHIDILVNNAGIDRIQPFLESEAATWDRLLAVNFRGTVAMCHVVAAEMTKRVGASGEVVYSGTKGGVIAFSKALAREVARYGVTVNVVCPGPTDTPLLDQVAEASQKLYDSIARSIPLRRIATPEDIAPAVAFFASDEAAYITGQTLSVSGGLTMA
jgi:2-hydroxycyclohexanecarboxyl-CoA dehydrogenase